MEALEHIIGTRARDLAQTLVQTGEFTEERAELFVVLAGTDLMKSIEWQTQQVGATQLGRTQLDTPSTVRDLLSTMGARRIARVLDMGAPEVWLGLRTLVPRLLQMAEAEAARPRARFESLPFRRVRRARFPA